MKSRQQNPTTIAVPLEVRRRLKDHQIGGKSVAQAIEDLMYQVPPDYFRRDLHRALAERPRLSLAAFRRKHRMPYE
jgi:hypothetical protein